MPDQYGRKHTPLDHIIKSPAQRIRERTVQFENEIVRYLVTRYGLEKAIPSLTDAEDESRHHDYRTQNLTLERFHRCFPRFPLTLTAYVLRPLQAKSLTVPRLLHDPMRSVLGRVLQEKIDPERDDHYALVFKYPYVSVADSLTLHNWPRVNYKVEGVHAVISIPGKQAIRLEPLSVLLGTLDTQAETWFGKRK